MANYLKAVLIVLTAMIGLVAVPASAYDWGIVTKKEERTVYSSANSGCLNKNSNFYCTGVGGENIPFERLMSRHRDWAWFKANNNIPANATPKSFVQKNTLYTTCLKTDITGEVVSR